jgi:hypothetical protein
LTTRRTKIKQGSCLLLVGWAFGFWIDKKHDETRLLASCVTTRTVLVAANATRGRAALVSTVRIVAARAVDESMVQVMRLLFLCDRSSTLFMCDDGKEGQHQSVANSRNEDANQ